MYRTPIFMDRGNLRRMWKVLGCCSALCLLAAVPARGQESGEILLELEISDGTRLTVEVPGEAPMSIEPRGVVRARMQIPLDVEALAQGRDLVGTMQLEDMLVAVPQILVRGRSTGIGCITIDGESGGTVTVSAQPGSVRIEGTASNRVRLTSPEARDLLGDLFLEFPVRSEIPVTLDDLLALAGGGSPPLEFFNSFEAVSMGGSNPLDGTRIRGLMGFQTASPLARSNSNLDVCREFLMGLGLADRR